MSNSASPSSSLPSLSSIMTDAKESDQIVRLDSAKGVFFYDKSGNEYLDITSGIASVGYCNEQVNKACRESLSKKSFFENDSFSPFHFRDLNSSEERYKQLLLETLSSTPKLDTILSLSSGSEAIDLACSISRSAVEGNHFLYFETEFHGSIGLYARSPRVNVDEDFTELNLNDKITFHALPIPECSRGRYSHLKNREAVEEKCLADIKTILEKLDKADQRICGLIFEPVFAFHSNTIPSTKFMTDVMKLIRLNGGLVIVDEVQTGLGRCGKYWGFQMYEDLIPDILITAKPLGNGIPLSICVTSSELHVKYENSRNTTSTHSMSHLQAAAGLATLSYVRQNKLLENAITIGDYLKDNIRKLGRKFIFQVNGIGLLLAVDFVYSDNIEPSKEIAKCILYKLREKRILSALGGIHGNLLYVTPSLIFGKKDADYFIQALDQCCREAEELNGAEILSVIKNGSKKFIVVNNLMDLDVLASVGSCHSPPSDNLVINEEDIVKELDESSHSADEGHQQSLDKYLEMD